VAVVPGSAFGSEGYIRLSFATSMKNLKQALERIAKALS
jgi:aspartate aminotransferase